MKLKWNSTKRITIIVTTTSSVCTKYNFTQPINMNNPNKTFHMERLMRDRPWSRNHHQSAAGWLTLLVCGRCRKPSFVTEKPAHRWKSDPFTFCCRCRDHLSDSTLQLEASTYPWRLEQAIGSAHISILFEQLWTITGGVLCAVSYVLACVHGCIWLQQHWPAVATAQLEVGLDA